MKGRIIAKFFIDKNGKFATKIDIRKHPETMEEFLKFFNSAALSMFLIYKKMGEFYGKNKENQ